MQTKWNLAHHWLIIHTKGTFIEFPPTRIYWHYFLSNSNTVAGQFLFSLITRENPPQWWGSTWPRRHIWKHARKWHVKKFGDERIESTVPNGFRSTQLPTIYWKQSIFSSIIYFKLWRVYKEETKGDWPNVDSFISNLSWCLTCFFFI